MTEENQNKHVTFAAGTSEGGTVEAVVERGQEAAGYVAETVMSYIPGTDEYEVRVHGQNLETSPVSPVGPVRHDTSPHDADAIAYEQGPATKPSSSSAPKDTVHTAEDIAYTRLT